MPLCFLFLWACCFCSVNYSTMNASFSWSDFTIWNHAAYTIYPPPTLPYQTIEDVTPNNMNGYFDFSNDLSIWCFQDVINNVGASVRADSNQANTVSISFSISGGGGSAGGSSLIWHSLIRLICYNRYFASNQTSLEVCVTIMLCGSGGVGCPSVTGQATVSGVLWNVGVQSYGYCMSQANLPPNYVGSINTADIGAYLISIGQLNQYDIMNWHTIEFRGGGAGTYTLAASAPVPAQRQITTPGIIAIGGWSFDNLQYLPNVYSAEYLNVSYPSSLPTVITGIIVDFYYTRNSLNAYPRIYAGYANGNWYTPLYTYGMPIAADNLTAGLLANFSYSQADSVLATKAACIGIILRNDYSPKTQTFSNPSTDPMLEIEVCLWWSIGLVRNGSVANKTIGLANFQLCSQSGSSADNLTHWPTYVYVANSNSLSVLNLDILAFVHDCHLSVISLTGYYVTGVYFGYRIYSGKGNFVYASVPQLSVVNTLPPFPPVIPVINATAIACPFSSYEFNTSKCALTQAGVYARVFLTQVISTPDIVLLLRLSPFVLIIDEFSYYAYHTQRYDRGFQFLAELSWEINNGKWIPPFLSDSYQKISGLLNGIQIDDWAGVTPPRFLLRSDTVYFLNNAQDFLFVNLPIAVVFFLLAMFLRRKATCWKIPVLLKPFATFSYLLVSIFGDNIQYLSFRTFQQLRFIVPKALPDCISIVLALTTLFGVVLCGSALYLLIWIYDRHFTIDTMKHAFNSSVLLTFTLAGRAFGGFIHAYIDNEQLQTSCLLVVPILVLIATAWYIVAFKVKRSLCLYLFSLASKTLVNMLLLIEIQLNFQTDTISVTEQAMSNLTTVLVYLLTGFFFLQYLLVTVWGFSEQIGALLKNYLERRNKRRKKIIKTKKAIPGVQGTRGVLNKGEDLQKQIKPKATVKIRQLMKRVILKSKFVKKGGMTLEPSLPSTE